MVSLMVASNVNQRLIFPTGEFKVQSPYLYLQSCGSTGADGSLYGAHLRWLLLRNLGDTHLPKGDYAATTLNFNRDEDYVTLLRSRYINRFPTIVDFSVAPNVVNDALAFWIYTVINTSAVVYIHFRDAARYTMARAGINPSAQPLAFIQEYCPGLIEAEVKDKLFFAAEFDVAREVATVMRVEALSVETNVALAPMFVSCRRTFTNDNWCPPESVVPPPKSRATEFPGKETPALAPTTSVESGYTGRIGETDEKRPEDAPDCCDGPNLLRNGGFENDLSDFGYETDYILQERSQPGVITVASDASEVNSRWKGLPHSGDFFLAVDGSVKAGKAALRFRLEVEAQTDYCFTGWLITLFQEGPVKLQFRFTSSDSTTQTFEQLTPATLPTWEQFTIFWNSGNAHFVVVEIISSVTAIVGNDFGLDDLWFCRSKEGQKECNPRLVSENIRSVRFEVEHGYPRRLEFETYEDYIAGALWEALDKLALTTTESIAFSRLEPAPNTVNGHWQKFNDNALLNVLNYEGRWTRLGGLREGIQRYITRSNTDPLALETLLGDAPQDGSIQISWLDALRMVSLDFHVARMLGLGYLDRDIKSDTDEYLYLSIYDTDGPLDDTNIARPVRHYYMGVPTKPLDYRLPDAPGLQPVTYGLTVDNGEPQPSLLTDSQGYTPDGLSRYVNLFLEAEPDVVSLNQFFVPPVEFCSIDKTSSVFYGIEYRKQGAPEWGKPEIAHDANYTDLDSPPQFETLPLPNNADPAKPILRHDERENGVHEYASYGINWFSRVSPLGNIVATDATLIKKAQRLLPPANLAAQLIQHESPLMLTTSAEQDALAALTTTDKTLVRVTCDYFHAHDINYEFADTIELFFRPEMPRNVVGAVQSVIDDPADNHAAIIHTTGYTMNSQGTTIMPTLDPMLFANFVGGVFSCQQQSYIVTNLASSAMPGEGPIFTVRKNVKGNASDPGSTGSFMTVQEYLKPELDASTNAQVMFMAVENMADADSWGTPNPLSKIVTIGDSTWSTHTEMYVQDGETITVNLRGVLAAASVEPQPLAPPGVYRIEFNAYLLPHHSQSGDADPVDWHKGIVRLPTTLNLDGPKKVLEVLLIENLGANQPLVLHVVDNDYDPNNPIITGTAVDVNYYPGYKVYLHAEPSHNFEAATILPAAGEGNRKTWLGARATDTTQQYHSAVGIPAPIIALEFVEPLAPEQPVGGEFATRPDFYYKSSYTFRLNFAHKPFAAAMYRANDEALLRALYKDATYNAVRQQLDLMGEDDPHRSDRWKNLLSFDYVYDVPGHPYYDPTNSNTNGTFRKFPREAGYAFPNPDKGGALNGSMPGSILEALKEAIWGAFTALTELPLIYDFIKGPLYVPVPKPQNIRNAQGILLAHNDPAFDMAPMAKRTGNGFEIQFTDFTLDGTSNNIFFYYGRELGNRSRLGDPGAIAGPIRLTNARPPDAPGVKKMYVQELNIFDHIGPAVNFEINAYPVAQNVRRMLIYRISDAAAALSVRTMQLVKSVDLDETKQIDKLNILLADDFESGFVPYGDPLFYRIVALRKIKNADAGTDWTPSQPSKLLLTTMIDTVNPEAPEITFTSDGLSGAPATLTGVILSWQTTVYNGTYYLDKQNAAGNWVTIYRVKTNDDVTLNLAATDLGTNVLPKENADSGEPIYNRFRVRVENSSGLFSLTDKALTI